MTRNAPAVQDGQRRLLSVVTKTNPSVVAGPTSDVIPLRADPVNPTEPGRI